MLKDKCAVITGASRGIGSAIAVKLAENGANVALLYKSNTEKAEEIKKACEGFAAEPFRTGSMSRIRMYYIWPIICFRRNSLMTAFSSICACSITD